MASGRRSSDPKDLLVVNPSQPEATKAGQKTSHQKAEGYFCPVWFYEGLTSRSNRNRMGSSGHQQLCPVLQQPSGNKAGHACTWSRYEHEAGH